MHNFLKTLLCAAILCFSVAAFADRIGDLTTIQGVRHNQLLGYGLVIGLTNTGDQNSYTDQSLKSLLNKYSINVPGNTNLNARNVAAVMVEARLPAFAKPGQTLDVVVSSIGNAKSLRNGVLLTTPLRGTDGNIYALAQGGLIVSGAQASGLDGSSIHINSANVGMIPSGATVERMVDTSFQDTPHFTFNLLNSNFTTSARVVEVINKNFGDGVAMALDATSIQVRAPEDKSKRVDFISMVNNLDVKPSAPEAKVVINSRTGTIVMTENVRVLPVAISEGGLVVNVSENQTASQPQPFANGETKILQNSQIKINKLQTALSVLQTGPTLNDVVRALNDVGASPKDLVQTLQLLKQAGALRAKLIVI